MKNFLSEKIKALAPSSTLAMLEKASRLKDAGESIIDLSLGEPDFSTPQKIKEAAKNAIDSDAYSHYPPVAGYEILRKEISVKLSSENNIECSFQNIVISNGVKQCLTNVLECITNPGDEIITFTPYWVSYAANVQLAGGVLIPVMGGEESSFEPTIDDIESKITQKTKAILFSNPCNPTGHILSKDYLVKLGQLVKKYSHILVISDEICEAITFGERVFSIGSLAEIKDRVITLNGVSKSHAMTGWRIGYSSSHVDIAKAITKLQGQTTSAPCGIAQMAALEAIKGGRELMEDMVEQYKERAYFLYNYFKNNTNLVPIKPLGAIYLFLSIKGYLNKKTKTGSVIKDATDFSLYILEEAKVAVVASDGFGIAGYIRISCAKNTNELQEAAKNIEMALKDLH